MEKGHVISFHLCEMSRIRKSIERDSRLVIAFEGGDRVVGERQGVTPKGYGYLYEVIKML